MARVWGRNLRVLLAARPRPKGFGTFVTRTTSTSRRSAELRAGWTRVTSARVLRADLRCGQGAPASAGADCAWGLCRLPHPRSVRLGLGDARGDDRRSALRCRDNDRGATAMRKGGVPCHAMCVSPAAAATVVLAAFAFVGLMGNLAIAASNSAAANWKLERVRASCA